MLMKRYLATALWFFAFWSLGSMVAALLGVPDLIGPVLAVAAGVIVGVDPRRVIWAHPTATTQAPAKASTTAAPNPA